ncbi:unnamed protein product [Closterium sp. NIES-54]
MGRHLATFTRRPGSSLYTLTTAPPPVSASGQVAASSQVFAAASRSSPASAPCSCRPLARETLLWHHRLGHPSLLLELLEVLVLLEVVLELLEVLLGLELESDYHRAASPTVTRFLATTVTDPLFESSAASALVAELVDFAVACRLDYAISLVAASASASICPPSVGDECALGTDVFEDR